MDIGDSATQSPRLERACRNGAGGSPARSGPARLALSAVAAALWILLSPPSAPAADGAQVLDCIKRVGGSSWASQATRELVAAVACRGIGGSGAGLDGSDFDRKVEIVRDCIEKVVFQSKAAGEDAELIAAAACVGTESAEETAACVDQVARKFQHVTGAAAEALAAQACARGNPAEETADCVAHVAFRLSASGAASEFQAVNACGR